MSKWQLIETAPKDGTIVDLWWRGGRRTDCCWEESEWKEGYTWVEQESLADLDNPTHWMPLPEPPEIAHE